MLRSMARQAQARTRLPSCKRVNIIYLDTGAMCRALALKALQSGLDTKDEEGLSLL